MLSKLWAAATQVIQVAKKTKLGFFISKGCGAVNKNYTYIRYMHTAENGTEHSFYNQVRFFDS